MNAPIQPQKDRPAIPRTVWVLGCVSLAMDVSSEIVHSLLPLFLTTTLGASVVVVGLIDGIAESAASIAKVVSGYVSDRMRRRKPLILLGYGLAALTKPLFPLAEGIALVFGARFVDRIGKGLRGAPRDALVADVTPESIRGRAFGLRQALDTTGAFLGPLLAIGGMFLFAGDIRSVLWIAVVPAGLAVLFVIVGVKDRTHDQETVRSPIRVNEVSRLSKPFWTIVVIGVVFTLARFSEAFLILKATSDGLSILLAPLVLIVMSVVYAAGAYPVGALADAFGTKRLLLFGIIALIAADLSLALFSNLAGAFVGIALWGVHMALTQGLLTKLVADHAPEGLLGSAFGVFNLFTGIALLCASVIAGTLWDQLGPEATFLAGAGFATAAGAMTLRSAWRESLDRESE
ncbi:MAG: MFS transporter [Bacteroidetes bacterium]|nr:MFS transporter [Bacteroidota bacterium]